MRALITGHAGYIGGVLEERLRTRGHDTRGYDHEDDPADDIRDRERVEAVIDRVEPDIVYHLAAEADVWAADWPHLVATNVLGTVNVIDAARERSIPVVHASSVAARGTFNRYGRSKRLAESAIDDYDAVAILRFPNVIGHAAPRGQVQSMIEQGLEGEIEVWGDGALTRTYVDVGDLAELLIDVDPTSARWTTGPVSVAAHTATNATIGERLRHLIADEVGHEPSIITLDRSPPAPADLSANGVTIDDPTPLEVSLRSQIEHALE